MRKIATSATGIATEIATEGDDDGARAALGQVRAVRGVPAWSSVPRWRDSGSWRRTVTIEGVRRLKTLRFKKGRSEFMAFAGKHEGALGAAFLIAVAEAMGNRTPRDNKELRAASLLNGPRRTALACARCGTSARFRHWTPSSTR